MLRSVRHRDRQLAGFMQDKNRGPRTKVRCPSHELRRPELRQPELRQHELPQHELGRRELRHELLGERGECEPERPVRRGGDSSRCGKVSAREPSWMASVIRASEPLASFAFVRSS